MVGCCSSVLLSCAKQRHARAQVFHDRVVEHTEAGAAAAGDAIVTFDGVAVLHPRGRFEIEMYATFLKLLGQARHRSSTNGRMPERLVYDRCCVELTYILQK